MTLSTSEYGKPPTDLDECNGHADKERGYHYHVTAKFPYIIGGYMGVQLARGGTNVSLVARGAHLSAIRANVSL